MTTHAGADRAVPGAGLASFEDEAADTLRRLRSALAVLIAAVPGRVSKAAELCRALKIDMKLSWKIFEVAHSAHPLAAGHLVPSPASMAKFFKAASQSRVPQPLVEAAASAVEQFERLVARHAGDRTTFDSMIAACPPCNGSGQLDLIHKRGAFRANSHLLGVQAGAQLKTVILQPAKNPEMLDCALINGFINLRQLRAGAPLVVSRTLQRDDDGAVRHPCAREPLDPEAESNRGLALLQAFCSKPLPRLRTTQRKGGYVYADLLSTGVGNTSAITYVEGHVARGALSRYRDEHNAIGQMLAGVHIPCESLVFDAFLRDVAPEGIVPEAAIYGDHWGGAETPVLSREQDRLPMRESVVHLGWGADALHTPDVPRYAEMAKYVFDRLGWDGNAFAMYRCRVEFPVMPSTVVIHFNLPERPRTDSSSE